MWWFTAYVVIGLFIDHLMCKGAERVEIEKKFNILERFGFIALWPFVFVLMILVWPNDNDDNDLRGA